MIVIVISDPDGSLVMPFWLDEREVFGRAKVAVLGGSGLRIMHMGGRGSRG